MSSDPSKPADSAEPVDPTLMRPGSTLKPADETRVGSSRSPAPERPPATARTPTPAPPLPPDLGIAATRLGSAPAPASEVERGGRMGHYQLLRRLGSGGMGSVYEAEDTLLHRKVAIKVMRDNLPEESDARERFLREARAAAAVAHDHVVTVFQVGEENGTPYIAMQLLHGQTLEDRLERNPVVSLKETVRVGREIAEGLAAAHDKGLIHRDVKPSNVWLEAETGRVKIVDFGLARATAEARHLTQSGMIVGTPAYMSPEQARGEELDARSDLFSLGCILYQMTTGERAFDGPTVVSILRSLELDTPAAVKVKKPDVPPALSNLIGDLLAKDRSARPASAREVARRLALIEANLSGATPAPAPPPTPGPFPAPAYAPRPHSGGSPLLLLAFLGILALAGWGFYYLVIAGDRGTLLVITEDPSVAVLVKQKGTLVATSVNKERELHLGAGEYDLELGDRTRPMILSKYHVTIEPGKRVDVVVTPDLGPLSP